MTNNKKEEEFRKWMFKIANTNEEYFIKEYKYDIILYMRCVFAINRDKKDNRYTDIHILNGTVIVYYERQHNIFEEMFHLQNHNNSELEAIESALKFVKEEMGE